MRSQLFKSIFQQFPKVKQYLTLKERVLSARIFQCADKKTEPQLEKITEKFIYYLWSEQPLRDLPYKTSDGREIKVVSPGLWNSNPGPDFTDVSLYLDEQLNKGDVEIHLYSSDWERHKHHLDNNYNNLILHIVLWDDDRKPILLNNRREVPQLVLAPLLRERVGDIDKLLDLDILLRQGSYFTSPGRCYSYVKQTPSQKTAYFLEGAGESRLLRKIDNFHNRLSESNNNYDEVLYQGIMTALGYKNNQLSFLKLAENMPYQKIRKIIQQYPKDKQPLVIQAVLFKTAGLIPRDIDALTPETRYYLQHLSGYTDLLMALPDIKSDADFSLHPRHGRVRRVASESPQETCAYGRSAFGGMDWQIPGGRPTNSPYRRLAGISYLLSREPSLFSKVVEIMNNPSGPVDVRKELVELLCVPATGYWSTRSTFDGRPFRKEYALIGRERVDEIILNIIIPVVFLHSQSNKDVSLQEKVLNLYRSYPKLMDNYYTRFMKQRLFQSEQKALSDIVKTACVQQGLIEIFLDFCKKGYEGCDSCAFLSYLKS
jgi:hypothetical protein